MQKLTKNAILRWYFSTDFDDNSANWLGQPMHMKMQSTSQEILCKNSLCFVTSFLLNIFAIRGRKMATYNQSFNEYCVITRQQISKFVSKNISTFL